MTILSDRDLADIRSTLAGLPDASTANVIILELRGPGVTDAYGEVADGETGTVQWSGEVSGHLRRSRVAEQAARGSTNVSSEGGTVVEADEIAVLRALLPDAVLVQAGSAGTGWTVLFTDQRPATPVDRRARVAAVTTTGDGVLADKVVFQLEEEQTG